MKKGNSYPLLDVLRKGNIYDLHRFQGMQSFQKNMADYESEAYSLKFYPRLPMLSNYRSLEQVMEEGIYVSYHQQPAWEMPESCHPYHVIGINMTRKNMRFENVLDGKKWIWEGIIDDDITINPAFVTGQSSWDRENDFMIIFLAQETIAQVAYETIDPDSVVLLPHFLTRDPIIHQIGRSLKAELETQGQWSRLFIDSLKTALAVNLLRRYAIHQGEIRDYTDGLSKYKLKQTIDYITDHLSENLSLLDIATIVKMSPCYFANLFKCSTGLTVSQYINQRRISKAKQLLRRPDLKIIEIAQAVGFESHSHFNRTFRKWTGSSPTAYRKDRK
jgi:AraC family transcriptional regulator